MNRSLIYSSAIHAFFFLLMLVFLHPSAQKTKAVYTIDFIGSASQPMRYGEPEPSGGAAQQKAAEPPKQEQSEIKAPKAEPVKEKAKPAKPKYNSEEQISAKAKKGAKETPKDTPKEEPKKEEKVVLSKPSILGEVESESLNAADLHNLGAGADNGGINAVRASFTNFPYPWYITQVRNSLWKQWEKRMPNTSGLSTLVSFNIDRYGAIYGVQIEKSSGNDSYDYAATSAVQNSAPYPPLPKGFGKDILTVTVEFKNED